MQPLHRQQPGSAVRLSLPWLAVRYWRNLMYKLHPACCATAVVVDGMCRDHKWNVHGLNRKFVLAGVCAPFVRPATAWSASDVLLTRRFKTPHASWVCLRSACIAKATVRNIARLPNHNAGQSGGTALCVEGTAAAAARIQPPHQEVQQRNEAVAEANPRSSAS